MLAKKIYKNIKEEKKELERKTKRHKAAKITTLTALGIGAATIGATMVYKKAKAKQDDYDYDDYGYGLDNIEEENEDYELKSKIEEFNSNRLSYDNEEHVSNEDMSKFINKIDNEDENLNENQFK